MPFGVFSEPPKFCPQCGKQLNVDRDQYTLQDWHAGASFSCECGFSFQKVEASEIFKVAADLAYYHAR